MTDRSEAHDAYGELGWDGKSFCTGNDSPIIPVSCAKSKHDQRCALVTTLERVVGFTRAALRGA